MSDTRQIPAMSPVESTNIESVGYSAPDKTMFIRFKSGGLYSYADVPPAVHTGFLDAKSPGNYFRAAVAGKFNHQKVQ